MNADDPGAKTPTSPVAFERMPVRFWEAVLVVVCLVVAGVLRGLNLHGRPLWVDELTTLLIVRRPLAEAIWNFQDVQPPLLQCLIRLTTSAFGETIWAIRGPSVVAGTLAIPAAWWFARPLFGRGVAAWTVVLMVFNAMLFEYAREARPYSLFVLFSILAMGFFTRVIRRGGTFNVAGYALAMGLATHAHWFAFLLFVAQGLYLIAEAVLNRMDRGLLRRSAVSIALGVLVSLPTLALAVRQVMFGISPTWISRIRLLDSYEAVGELIGVAALGSLAIVPVVAAFWPGRTLFDRRSQAVADTGLSAWWRNRRDAALPALWVLMSFFLPVIISNVFRPVFVLRYTLPALVPLIVLGVVWLNRSSRSAMVLLALLVLADGGKHIIERYRSPEPGLRDVVAWVDTNLTEHQPLYIADWAFVGDFVSPELVGLEYYGISPDHPIEMVHVAEFEKAIQRDTREHQGSQPSKGVHPIGPTPLPRDKAVVLCYGSTRNPVLDWLRRAGRPYDTLEFGTRDSHFGLLTLIMIDAPP